MKEVYKPLIKNIWGSIIWSSKDLWENKESCNTFINCINSDYFNNSKSNKIIIETYYIIESWKS